MRDEHSDATIEIHGASPSQLQWRRLRRGLYNSPMSPAARDIFPHHLEFDPGASFEEFLKQAPAKWTVYLMTDEHDTPVQLLCVKNLRASLKRRLGGDEPIGPTRKVNYKEIIRRIHYRRVDSAFEADWIYLLVAREIFPQTYRGMVGFRPAWFVHVNPRTKFPRWIKTINLAGQTGRYFGPLEDKHSAQKLVHLMESLFDLCRDYSILIQSPHAGPCAWKQMGKCVGPCDGTISLEAYAELIAHSTDALADPKAYTEQETKRMNAAASELRFETAQKIKLHIQQLSQLGKGPFRHARPLEQFQFLTLQRGPRGNSAKLFLITPGHIEELANLIAEPGHPSDVLQLALTRAAQRPQRIDEQAEELIAIVAHHLFIARHKQGVFLDLAKLDGKTLIKGYHDLMTQKAQEIPEEGEGVTRELQAM